MTHPVEVDAPTCAVRTCPEQGAPFCARHRGHLERAFREGIARLYVDLTLAVRGQLGNNADADGVRVAMTREVGRAPIAVGARALQECILADVLHLEALLRQSQGWAPAPPRGREGPTLQGACRVLAEWLDQLLADPAAVTPAAELLRRLQGARFSGGQLSPRKTRQDTACPHCGHWSLLRHNGTDDIACGYCAAVISADEFDQQLAA